jgi:hypothetical protein
MNKSIILFRPYSCMYMLNTGNFLNTNAKDPNKDLFCGWTPLAVWAKTEIHRDRRNLFNEYNLVAVRV